LTATRIAFEKQWLSPKSDFDLGGLATYYTRPMRGPREVTRPVDWSVFAARIRRSPTGC
jgi:hypothetical protein